MAIKLNLEKAFDKIEWHFIKGMLYTINVPPKLIRIILSCLTTSNLAILVNSQPTNFFQPSLGVKQGDHLSPYLFILGIEFLSLLIHNQVANKNWHLIPITPTGPYISHTLFADDVFLFAEASISSAKTISNVIDDFTYYSGLHINYTK